MSHDPRAPRLAAIATLVAGGLLVLSATNLQFNLVGQAGITREEMWAVVGAAVAIVIAKFANEEHEVPELGQSIHRDQPGEEAYTRTRDVSSLNAEVNPTTASIITSILGERTTTESHQVDAAIHTLSSGAFGASVLETIRDVEATNDRNRNMREAQPTDEETGQTLKRVLVQPVPLPGRENEPLVDPSTIPGLDPNREFVRDGLASVPLPGAVSADLPDLPDVSADLPDLPDVSADLPDLPDVAADLPDLPVEAADIPELPDFENEPEEVELPMLPEQGGVVDEEVETPTLPSIPDLPDLSDLMQDEIPMADEAPETVLSEVDSLPELVLPDIDDLFADEEVFVATGPVLGVPDLPDLDDLF